MISPARMRAARGWATAVGAIAALVPAAPALAAGKASPDGVKLATTTPTAAAHVIVQFDSDVSRATAEGLVREAGGDPGAVMPIINALSARLTAAQAKALAGSPGVRAVSMNAKVKPQAISTSALATAYDLSVGAERAWNSAGLTGKGVGVAVIDSGIAGDLPDFRTSSTNAASRVVATAVTNPNATTAGDPYGHGTHVAGIVAGNGWNRPASDANDGKYVGIAPEANLVSIKVG